MEMKQKHEPCEVKVSGTLYKIGMFAAMNHVTVKTLRFYEEQGLLTPALINRENGYRYYRLSQMAVIHQITALKMAGFTLEEIASINAGADEEAVLLKKKAELIAKIADLTRQIAIVDSYLSKKENGLSAPVLVKTIRQTTVAAMQTRIESYDRLFEVMPKMGSLMEKVGCECAVPETALRPTWNRGTKTRILPLKSVKRLRRPKRKPADCISKPFPQYRQPVFFTKAPIRHWQDPMKGF